MLVLVALLPLGLAIGGAYFLLRAYRRLAEQESQTNALINTNLEHASAALRAAAPHLKSFETIVAEANRTIVEALAVSDASALTSRNGASVYLSDVASERSVNDIQFVRQLASYKGRSPKRYWPEDFSPSLLDSRIWTPAYGLEGRRDLDPYSVPGPLHAGSQTAALPC